jgi:hypothetical protein
MATVGCEACGREPVRGAQFCQHCGHQLQPLVTGSTFGDPDDTSGSPVWLPVAMVAAVVALLFAFVALGDNEPETEGSETAASLATTVARPTPTPESTATPAPVAPPPTVRPTPMPELVDPALLPQMAASHLVVGSVGALHFLDLAAGMWTTMKMSFEPQQLMPLADGVVFASPSGAVRYVRHGSSEIVSLVQGNQGGLIGVVDDLVILNFYPGTSSVEATVEARRVDGTLAWSIRVPQGAFAQGVTSNGQVALQANELVGVINPVDGSFNPLGTGTIHAIVGNLLFVQSCRGDLDCGFDQIDTHTGERSRVIDEPGWLISDGRDRLMFSSTRDQTRTLFVVVDGELTALDGDPPDDFFISPPPSVTDESGVTVTLYRNRIQFLDSAGVVLADIAEAGDGFRGNPTAITLIGNAGS